MRIIPVRTRILTEKDDLLAVLREEVVPKLRTGDGIVVASKVVSIMQGRAVRPDQIRIGHLARYGARFFPEDGSLSSPYSLQAVIDEVGRVRILVAFVVAGIGKVLFRRRGDFYRVAGGVARAVDDVSGNTPPFDKHIVLAPLHPRAVAETVKRELGYECAIVDANDLGMVDVLGSSPGIDVAAVEQALKGNPCGNGHQKQPFAIIRR